MKKRILSGVTAFFVGLTLAGSCSLVSYGETGASGDNETPITSVQPSEEAQNPEDPAQIPEDPTEPTDPDQPVLPDISNKEVTGLKASSSGVSSVKISWNKVSGASGYEVFQATSKSGKYTSIGITSKTSFTETKLTAGKSYYYKVNAYQLVSGETIYSKLSEAVSAVPKPKSPAKVTLTAGEAKITVKWSKVSGASGYRIYRATSSKGNFKRIATVSAKKSRKYTNKNLKNNKKYYYKVRAYTTVNKKKVFGPSSKVVSKKTLNMLDKRVNKVYNAATKNVEGKEKRLRACYKYMIKHYTYTKREYVAIGAKGWEATHANRFLKTGTGNCYDWAATFYYLAKKCGYSPTTYSGQVHYRNGNTGRHGWTEITIDGTRYVFDPEMEWSYTHRVGSHYNGWKRKVGTTEMTYIKP